MQSGSFARDVSVSYADELVKEYLTFRGFTHTLRTFEGERKQDKTKGFQAEKIVEQIFVYLHNYEITKVCVVFIFLIMRLVHGILALFRK